MYGTRKRKDHDADSDDEPVCLHCKEMVKRFPRVSAQEREAREKRMRQKLGLPGPIDIWLTSKIKDDPEPDRTPLAPEEVRCTVYIERIPFPNPHEYFMDDDTYVLHLTVTSAPLKYKQGTLQWERTIALCTYDRSIHSMEAPDWVKLPTAKTMVFRDSAAAVIEVLRRTSHGGNELASALESLAALSSEDE
ncbi:hypothetical protein PYCCODRAFT_1440164 [Trametes coccinea BRFM310]|uniref:Uncharacterized protein n=1 Tax=Trametes coccinea (strain BRFM310) TaxID=1353009 RepID=A0A1Y2I8Q6_TRAC3|nr:hypothetical protein PYCCODRAFT_1440164 [Trametes coccinea BRFM310]